ncbi:MAG TPA: hypothetical protein VJA18_01540 [Candidatus Nanoarchaeia archaeon]|nr:hypothetical protein [Candidatus Nanoarchaeia archaeon]
MTNKYTEEGLPIITLEAINQYGRESFCDSIGSLNERNRLFSEQIVTTNPYVSFYMERCLDNIDNNHFWLFVYTGMSGLYRLMQIQEEINGREANLPFVTTEAMDDFDREILSSDPESSLLKRIREIDRTNKGVSSHMNITASIFTGGEKIFIYDTASGLYRLMQIQAEMDKEKQQH